MSSVAGLGNVQRVRKRVLLVSCLALVALMLVTASDWPLGGSLHEAIEEVGLGLIIVCILGRTWASLYIGGRKTVELALNGPYSIMRNPLYTFSIIGAAGVGAQLGSVVAGLGAGLICWLVFRIVVTREERVLQDRFGETYRAYLSRVPRFLPDVRLWQDTEQLTVRPALVASTFGDALLFLMAIPVLEAIELAQRHGMLAILFHLP